MTGDFHALHHRDEALLLPNAWDYASAAALAQAGFAAVGTTSLGVAAAAGKPDAEAATRDETLALAAAIAGLGVPVTVDIESGFGGGPDQVAELAARLVDLGVAGVNLEDAMADPARLAEVVQAVKQRTPGLFVNARTDAYWLKAPEPLKTALERAERYAAAGADGFFVPGIADATDIATVVREVPLPVNVLFLPGRHTVAELGALGVRRISLGSLLFRAALHATVETAQAVAAGRPVPKDLPTYAEVAALTAGR